MSKMTKGIILAAGRGNRLKELSSNKPKPMVEVNGQSIISNLVEIMIENNINDIVVVVGYKADLIKEHLAPYKSHTNITFVTNKDFDTTNNIYSLWLANKYLEDGFYLFEADIFIEKNILSELTSLPNENIMLISKFKPTMNGTVVTVNENNIVDKMILKKDQHSKINYSSIYKTVNFYKIGKTFYQEFYKANLDKAIKDNDMSSYYELILKYAIDKNYKFYGLKTGNLKWWEIDTKEDLKITEKLFSL